MGVSFHAFEAAAYFGIPYDEFRRKPLWRRAEMIAHMMIKNTLDAFMHERAMAKGRKDTSFGKGGYNPIAAQKAQWRI